MQCHSIHPPYYVAKGSPAVRAWSLPSSSKSSESMCGAVPAASSCHCLCERGWLVLTRGKISERSESRGWCNHRQSYQDLLAQAWQDTCSKRHVLQSVTRQLWMVADTVLRVVGVHCDRLPCGKNAGQDLHVGNTRNAIFWARLQPFEQLANPGLITCLHCKSHQNKCVGLTNAQYHVVLQRGTTHQCDSIMMLNVKPILAPLYSQNAKLTQLTQILYCKEYEFAKYFIARNESRRLANVCCTTPHQVSPGGGGAHAKVQLKRAQ
eukprot:6196084-Amphidinium_carterae.1